MGGWRRKLGGSWKEDEAGGHLQPSGSSPSPDNQVSFCALLSQMLHYWF